MVCAAGIASAAPVPDQERIPAGEARAIATIASTFKSSVADGYKKKGRALRDAHAKGQGCVRARFTVRGGLAADLRAGVFATPRSYDAWLRFSNGSEDIQADRTGDGRGVAVKLLGVPGRKLLRGEADASTQDFLGINFPVFFVRNVADYVLFSRAKADGAFGHYLAARPHEARIIAAINGQKIHDVADLRYFSMTPFTLGNRYMKFAVTPARCPNARAVAPMPAATGADYLRVELSRRLAAGAACFTFDVQLQTDPATMPIEDPTVEWNATAAPFASVADIVIEPQTFDSPAQQTFCENLSYTPWHAVPALRPVGGINRVRKVVYDEISKLRHTLNNATQKEPG